MQEGATGLYYMRRRYYDSRSARFLSVDPSPSLDARAIDPYQFAFANPVEHADPTGASVTPASSALNVPSGMPPQMVLAPPQWNGIATLPSAPLPNPCGLPAPLSTQSLAPPDPYVDIPPDRFFPIFTWIQIAKNLNLSGPVLPRHEPPIMEPWESRLDELRPTIPSDVVPIAVSGTDPTRVM